MYTYVFFIQSSTKAETLFKDKLVQFRLVCLGSLNKIDQVFVAGEDQAFIECDDSDIVKGLVDLFILLRFVHTTKYSSYMSELRSQIDNM